MSDKKWRFREDMLGHYINNSSSRTFQDAENRLNYLEKKEQLPDMRNKVKEYISDLDTEINRCTLWIEENMNGEACRVSEMEGRLKVLSEVKNDLQGRLNELI